MGHFLYRWATILVATFVNEQAVDEFDEGVVYVFHLAVLEKDDPFFQIVQNLSLLPQNFVRVLRLAHIQNLFLLEIQNGRVYK